MNAIEGQTGASIHPYDAALFCVMEAVEWRMDVIDTLSHERHRGADRGLPAAPWIRRQPSNVATKSSAARADWYASSPS